MARRSSAQLREEEHCVDQFWHLLVRIHQTFTLACLIQHDEQYDVITYI